MNRRALGYKLCIGSFLNEALYSPCYSFREARTNVYLRDTILVRAVHLHLEQIPRELSTELFLLWDGAQTPHIDCTTSGPITPAIHWRSFRAWHALPRAASFVWRFGVFKLEQGEIL